MASKQTEVKKRALVYPSNFDSEQSLLCCFLIDGEVVSKYATMYDKELFFTPRHKDIFQAIKDLCRTGSVDIITVNDQLVRNGKADETTLEYLTDLANMLPSSANCKNYIDILYRDMILRDVITSCNQIIENAYASSNASKTLEYAEQLIYGISQKVNNAQGLTEIAQATSALLNRINTLAKDKNALKGLMTGFPRFDKITNGLQKGDLIILAARPSVGKTAFAFNIVGNIFNNSKEAKTMAIFSLEMPAIQLAQRLMCNLANVPMGDISEGKVNSEGLENMWILHQKLTDSKIYIDDRSLVTPENILSQCRRLPSKANSSRVDLVVIDYLQLMQSGGRTNSRQEEVADMSRMMKIMAKELNCPVILLSQMSRGIENRTDKTPMLSDLRESGSIEQDADIVMFLSREVEEEKHNSPILLDIAKHRNGELSKLRFSWQGEYMRFLESDNQSEFASSKKQLLQKTTETE